MTQDYFLTINEETDSNGNMVMPSMVKVTITMNKTHPVTKAMEYIEVGEFYIQLKDLNIIDARKYDKNGEGRK